MSKASSTKTGQSSHHAGLGSQRYLRLFERLMPLIGSHEREVIAQQSCDLIAEMLEVEACSLFLADIDQQRLDLVAATHIPEDLWSQVHIPIDQGISGRVFREGKSRLISNQAEFKQLFGRQSEDRYRTATCVVVPVVIRGWTSGVINVSRPKGRRVFRHRDLDLLEAAANLIAAAMGHAIQNCEMMELQRNLEVIFDSLHVGILSVSRQEVVIHTNQRAREMLGLKDRTDLHFELGEVLPGTVYNVCQRLMRESNHREEPLQERIRAVFGGTPAQLQVTASRLRYRHEGSDDHLIILEDVGQEEEVNRLRESENMKHLFLSIISHELRTPLAVIRGALPLIDPEKPVKKEVLAQVHGLLGKNCQRLSDIVNSILDVTEIESGTLQLAPQPMDLKEMLEEILHAHKDRAAQKGVTLVKQFDESIEQIRADKRRVRQVISELIGNAIKFSFNNHPVTIVTRVNSPWIEILISDIGQKICSTERKMIFNKFFQVDSSSTRTAGGCGLGLYLAHNIIRLHQGQLQLLDQDGDETTFVIQLPINLLIMPGHPLKHTAG